MKVCCIGNGLEEETRLRWMAVVSLCSLRPLFIRFSSSFPSQMPPEWNVAKWVDPLQAITYTLTLGQGLEYNLLESGGMWEQSDRYSMR